MSEKTTPLISTRYDESKNVVNTYRGVDFYTVYFGMLDDLKFYYQIEIGAEEKHDKLSGMVDYIDSITDR